MAASDVSSDEDELTSPGTKGEGSPFKRPSIDAKRTRSDEQFKIPKVKRSNSALSID